MHECYITFASPKDVHEFVSITTQQFYSVHVDNGEIYADGKSIMSLFCMGLNRRLHVLYPSDAPGFLQAVESYLVA